MNGSDHAFRKQAESGEFFGPAMGVSNKYYHDLNKYWSSTSLKFMASTSPLHFRAKFFDSLEAESKHSDARALGSLVHCYLLSPGEFESEFFKMPELNLRLKEDRAIRDQIALDNVGKTLVDDELIAKAKRMADSVMNHRRSRELLAGASYETAHFWQCPFSGLRFRSKVDSLFGDILCELKTTGDGSPQGFAKQVFNLDYDLSLVHYAQGVRATLGHEISRLFFITVESVEPHCVQHYGIAPGWLEIGHAKWLDAITKLSRGVHEGIWPGYWHDDGGADPVLDAPAWELRKIQTGDNDGV